MTLKEFEKLPEVKNFNYKVYHIDYLYPKYGLYALTRFNWEKALNASEKSPLGITYDKFANLSEDEVDNLDIDIFVKLVNRFLYIPEDCIDINNSKWVRLYDIDKYYKEVLSNDYVEEPIKYIDFAQKVILLYPGEN